MERILKVISQGEYTEREWENKNHEKVIISSVELELTDGIDSVVAEVTDEKAKILRNTPLVKGEWYPFSLQMAISSWQRQDGKTARANRVRVLKIGPSMSDVKPF